MHKRSVRHFGYEKAVIFITGAQQAHICSFQGSHCVFWYSCLQHIGFLLSINHSANIPLVGILPMQSEGRQADMINKGELLVYWQMRFRCTATHCKNNLGKSCPESAWTFSADIFGLSLKASSRDEFTHAQVYTRVHTHLHIHTWLTAPYAYQKGSYLGSEMLHPLWSRSQEDDDVQYPAKNITLLFFLWRVSEHKTAST